MKYSFLTEDPSGKIIFNGYYMEVYVPAKVLGDERMFESVGEDFKMIGLVNFKVYKDESDKKGKMYTLSIPSTVVTSPTSIKKDKINILEGEEDEDENYTILQYWNDDIFIHSTEIKQDANEAFKFIKMVHSGRVPRAIEYNKLLELYNNGATNIHGVGLGVPSAIIEMVIADISRDASDTSKPFRLKAGKNPNINQHAYQPINMKNLPILSSTFAALSFERINDSIVSSVNKSKNNIKDLKSPIEKSIKY